MEITGTVKVVGETVEVSDKFKKRDLVITDNSSQYPQHISMQCTQDKVSLLDNLPIGTEIKAHINLRGREWTSPQGELKHFNTIECWRLETVREAMDEPATSEPKNDSSAPEGDDLPF